MLKPGLWPALVDPTQIELIILNLAINARDAMEVGGALVLETGNVTLTAAPVRPEESLPGDYVMLSVSDTGIGMTPEILEKVFEPFFTTKDPGRGSGLGLAQVYGFAKQSGGGVRIETRPGEGTTVEVFLPKATGAVADRERNTGDAKPPSYDNAEHSILVVDDDTSVRKVITAMLEDLGYCVIAAASGGAALDILRGNQPIDLMLVDYAMLGMNGVETVRAAAEIRPELPAIFVTGYADLQALHNVGEDCLVRKPFRR